ncbi:MAG: hypothetical protein WHS90_20630, partial [Caldilinea sp.]|uniref:hypothetical protein n=1 Tax=Caldilinea sp. TaxID=2293560 RepID=UPI0030A6FC3E
GGAPARSKRTRPFLGQLHANVVASNFRAMSVFFTLLPANMRFSWHLGTESAVLQRYLDAICAVHVCSS